jgi:hypothetical protein
MEERSKLIQHQTKSITDVSDAPQINEGLNLKATLLQC